MAAELEVSWGEAQCSLLRLRKLCPALPRALPAPCPHNLCPPACAPPLLMAGPPPHASPQVPPLTTNATGTWNGTLQGDTMAWDLAVQNIENMTMAHLHMVRTGTDGATKPKASHACCTALAPPLAAPHAALPVTAVAQRRTKPCLPVSVACVASCPPAVPPTAALRPPSRSPAAPLEAAPFSPTEAFTFSNL